MKKRKVHVFRLPIFNRWHRLPQPKKKKKPVPAESTSVIETTAQDVAATKESTKQSQMTAPVPTVKNEKKALKKAKAKEKKAANDELDQALAELSMQYSFMLFVPEIYTNLFQDTPRPIRSRKPVLAVIL